MSFFLSGIPFSFILFYSISYPDEERRLNISTELIFKLIDLLRREDPSSESRVDLAMGLYGVIDSRNVATSLDEQTLNKIILSLHPLVAVSPDYSRPNFNRKCLKRTAAWLVAVLGPEFD